MKYKESNKQKYYMRNVYINQIMKPEIQNNLNYAYFEDPGEIPSYKENKSIHLNPNNIFFNNKSLKNFPENYFPNQLKVNKPKKSTISQKKIKNERYSQNQFMDFNDANLFMNNNNKKSFESKINDRSLSENKINNFFQTSSFFKKKEKNNENITNLKINQTNAFGTIVNNKNKNDINYANDIHFFDNKKSKVYNNELISSRNSNSNSTVKSDFNSKKSICAEMKKKKNSQQGKNKFYEEIHKNEIKQINNILSKNSICSTTPNNNYKFKKNYNEETNTKNSIKSFKSEINQIKSYKNVKPYTNPGYKSIDKNSSGIIINYKNYMNNYISPDKKHNKYQNIGNISTLNSPSIPSYSSIIEENNSINSKNYVWVKKNIKNNNKSTNLGNNYLNNYYQNPNINQENIIHQNLINFANDITNINSYLYNTQVIFPNIMNKSIKSCEELNLFELSATRIQATFRGFLFRNKFESFFYKYKYYYHKGLEILELILNYYFKKKINLIKEKYKFFNYLISLTKTKNNISKYKNPNNNKLIPKTKTLNKLKNTNSTFSPTVNNGKKTSKYYNDLFLHKEIGERFNIIKENKVEKDIEKNYKEKINVINIKVNKLTKENNKLKDMNQKNIIMEKKFRDISKENKKKDDIINIITNDNKTLARKLKIIQDKFNELQIQNQEDINYNSEIDRQFNKNNTINFFEEYRNLFLSFLIYKNREKYYVNTLRKYFNKWKNIILSIKFVEQSKTLIKKEKLKYLINNIERKENIILSKNFYKFHYQCLFRKKEEDKIKNNIIKYKLLNIFKNKERSDKSNLQKYFYKFYYKGIKANKHKMKNKNIIAINKENYKIIKKFLVTIKNKKDKRSKNILREYFIKWHLYTKVLALKTLINDRRRKKRQKQKLKKKNEIESNNKYLTKNKILHFGKSNIYILNKDKEKDLLISLDNNKNYLSSQENINLDAKLNNVVKATNKLGEIFNKAAIKYKFIEDKESNKNEIKENYNKEKFNVNINDNNELDEEEDSGDSFGI